MEFLTAEEMNRNAKIWLVVLILGLIGFVTVTLIGIALIAGGDELLLSIAKTFSGK